MKRKSPQSRALPNTQPGRTKQTDAKKALAAPSFIPPPTPMPAALARWTGNLVYWASSLGAQYYAQAVAPLGLNPAQIAILQILDAEGSMRQARLTDRTRIDKATMVGLLNRLEAQNLIERRPAVGDKRAFDIYLTTQGKDRMGDIEVVSQAAEAEFYGVLSPEDRATLRSLLTALVTRTTDADKPLGSGEQPPTA